LNPQKLVVVLAYPRTLCFSHFLYFRLNGPVSRTFPFLPLFLLIIYRSKIPGLSTPLSVHISTVHLVYSPQTVCAPASVFNLGYSRICGILLYPLRSSIFFFSPFFFSLSIPCRCESFAGLPLFTTGFFLPFFWQHFGLVIMLVWGKFASLCWTCLYLLLLSTFPFFLPVFAFVVLARRNYLPPLSFRRSRRFRLHSERATEPRPSDSL